MVPSVSKVFSQPPVPLHHSQVRRLLWQQGRALGLFDISVSRKYTHHHSLQEAKTTNATTRARKGLPSAHQTDRVAVSAVESTCPTGGRATEKRVGIVTKSAVIYALVTSSILVSIVALSTERVKLSYSLDISVLDRALDHWEARLRGAWACQRLIRFEAAV
jgi:hypothetical protein